VSFLNRKILFTQKKEAIFRSVVAFLFFSTMFLNIELFVESSIISKHYAFVTGTILCLIVWIPLSKKSFYLDRLVFALGFFIGYIFIRCLISSVPDIRLLLFPSFFLLFLFFRSFNFERNSINVMIITACLFQACYGIMQYFGLFSVIGGFKVIGSFDNPAVSMIVDKPILGFGSNGFSSQYMLYQANFFIGIKQAL